MNWVKFVIRSTNYDDAIESKQTMYLDLGTVYVAQDDNGWLVHNGGQALDVVIHTDTHWELANPGQSSLISRVIFSIWTYLRWRSPV
jgi:hypothetical protein